MDFVDKQLDSLKTLSRSIAITMATLASTSIYVVQRDLRVIGGVLDAMGGQSQVQYSLLSFNYATMTFVWPFVLGGACVAVRLLINKREAVLQELLGSTPAKTLIASDPWYFNLDVSSKIIKVLGCLLLLLPGLAISLILVGLFVAQEIGSITSAFQLTGIVFGLCCVPSLWQSLKILIAQKQSDLLDEPSLEYVEALKGELSTTNSTKSSS